MLRAVNPATVGKRSKPNKPINRQMINLLLWFVPDGRRTMTLAVPAPHLVLKTIGNSPGIAGARLVALFTNANRVGARDINIRAGDNPPSPNAS